MKHVLRLAIVVSMVAALPSKAVPFTSSLNELSNLVAQAYETTDIPRAKALLGKALSDFEKPSDSVAGDYNIFVAVAGHLLPVTKMSGTADLSLQLLTLSSNIFGSFAVAAETDAFAASNRVAALSNFQPNKRAAANQVRAAFKALDTVQDTSSIQLSMLSLRLAFLKVGLANKLAAKAELKPDYAPDSVAGRALTHVETQSGGTVTFISDTEYTEQEGMETRQGTYTYDHNGLNRAYLVLTGESQVVKVKMLFTGANAGTFTAVATNPDGTERQAGTFTLDSAAE